jgi:hypothetical protein
VTALVQYHGQQRLVDCDSAVVFDEAQFPEFVHEKFTRERVVPTMLARVPAKLSATCEPAGPVFRSASNSKVRASLFSLELNS